MFTNGMVDMRADTSITQNKDKEIWFAMRAPFCREMEADRLLKARDIESFIPMSYRVVVKRNGTKSREFVPSVHNLIFVHTTPHIMRDVKKEIAILQYCVRREDGKNLPIIVPDGDMEQFIAVTKHRNEKLIYLKPEEIDLKKGSRVRVVGGLFDGVVGIFMKIKGIRNRRVVIRIGDIAAVAMAEISPDLIEVLPDES